MIKVVDGTPRSSSASGNEAATDGSPGPVNGRTRQTPSSSMKHIALISKSGPAGGGASLVASQLLKLLSVHGSVQAEHWTGDKHPGEGERSLRSGRLNDALFRLSRYASRKSGYTDLFNMTTLDRLPGGKPYDLFHLHDISSVLSPWTVTSWSKHSPIVWTFHDCSPFTGGCIYPLNCTAFLDRCGKCPQLGRWPMQTSFDHTGYMQQYKIQLVNERVSAVVCPSRWIAEEAQNAGIRADILRVIPNSVDTKVFTRKDRRVVRQRFGIPSDAFGIFLGSAALTNPYKGTQHALRAIARIEQNVHVMIVGGHQTQIHLPTGPTYHIHGFTTDRSLLADMYSACDVSLLPSLAENFPLMLLESMACGTPVVAFNTGGIGEAITHMKTGWLSTAGDDEGLARGLAHAIANPQHLAQWSEGAATSIAAHFTEVRFLESHLQLYEDIVDSWKPPQKQR